MLACPFRARLTSLKFVSPSAPLRSIAALGLIAVLCAAQPTPSPWPLRLYDFGETGADTGDFRITYLDKGSAGRFSARDGALRHESDGSGAAVFVYDTDPAASDHDAFTNVAVEFDFHASSANTSFGVLFGGRNGADYHLALFNIDTNAAGDDTLRVFAKCKTYASAVGPQVGETMVLPSGPWTSGEVGHALLTVAYTTARTADITFSITDPAGRRPPLSRTLTGVTVAHEGAGIGFRSSLIGGSGGTNTFDNITITRLE